METENSGSIKDWKRTPNLTPRGFEIKKDELYVLNGDTIIKIYHLLMNQRASYLLTLTRISPTDVAMYEEHLALSKYINMTMYHILHALPLANVLQMQEEASHIEKEKSETSRQEGFTLKQILDKFHLSEGGKDEMKPPSDSTDKTPKTE